MLAPFHIELTRVTLFSDMEWRGYIGDERYTPPFTCDEGLINIQSVNSIYCEEDGQTDCQNVCPKETMEGYSNHYDRLLEFNGTTGHANLSPPSHDRPNRCGHENNYRVECIQICGSCVIGMYPFCSL